MPVDAAGYLAGNFQRQVERPRRCPHCRTHRPLEALGYYSRNLTGARGTVVSLPVRRFRCRRCGRTVSILPSFAQPYRLIQNTTINRYFGGNVDALWWQPILKRYWNRFVNWIPELSAALRRVIVDPPSLHQAAEWWTVLTGTFGDLGKLTREIVSRFRITVFARYQCHSPIPMEWTAG